MIFNLSIILIFFFIVILLIKKKIVSALVIRNLERCYYGH
jgi:hypothetical protein